MAIVNGKPKILALKDFISEFVTFREKTVTRKIHYELAKTEERAHVLIGIATAVENIDPIIKIIKNSKDTETARKNLLNKKWSIRKSSKLVSLIEKKTKYFKIPIEQNSSRFNFRSKTSKTNCIWN